MVADRLGSLLDWQGELSRLKAWLGALPQRVIRRTASAFIDGLVVRGGLLHGRACGRAGGPDRPYRILSLLGRNSRPADELRDAVRQCALEALCDFDGILVVDETVFVKRGVHSDGVARQYSGTAGRIENARVGVFLAYASRFGQTLIDRRLYLPEIWGNDAARRAEGHLPETISFATKISMARDLIATALDTGARHGWVLADALYGVNYRLPRMLERRKQSSVLAVRSNHALVLLTPTGLMKTDPATVDDERPADEWTADRWTWLAAGEGSKGQRFHGWARLAAPRMAQDEFDPWLLLRRNRKEREKRAYYLAFAPKSATLAQFAGAAGLRWIIEERFGRAKSDLGLDHCKARSWNGRRRHMTPVTAAAALLVKLAAELRRTAFGKANERSPVSMAAAAAWTGSRTS